MERSARGAILFVRYRAAARTAWPERDSYGRRKMKRIRWEKYVECV
jgi:hypothetical protein